MRTAILGPAQAFGTDVWSDTKVTSRLTQFVARADLARAGMLPAVVPITGAGLLVGLVVLAAATVFWVQRRRQELLVLAAHGVGTPALGIKALVEALPALTAGTVAGWACSWTLVRWVGPNPVLSGEAAPLAALGAATAFAAGLIVVGVVAALACRPLTDQIPRRRRGVLRRIPWELLLLAGAPGVWRWLGGARELVDGADAVGSVMHVPGRLLVVPIMVITGLAVLAGRLGASYLRLRGLRRRPRAPATFLSWRRIARWPAAAALLAGATAIPISLATYGATVTGSVQATTTAEARLRIGSDVVLTLREPAPIPASLLGQATEVLRLDGAIIGGIQADVLVVDPTTFARNAYWGPQLDSAAVQRLLAPLTTDDGGPVTLIGAAPLPPGDQPATLAGVQIMGGRVHIVPTATLPAQRGGYPVALVPENALSRGASQTERQLWVRGERQLWVRGDPAQIRATAAAAGLPVTRVESATDRYVNTVWEPLTYTFDYLMALCLLTGVVTVVVLLLYLESQAPARRRAYVLLRRMGLSARQHRRAVLAELAIPLTGGLLAGLAVTAGLTIALGPEFEMNPDTPPNIIVAVPYLPIGLTIAAVITVATGATLYAHRRIAGANPSEVLRDAG
jgi:putative ABC transport system permease protein